MIKGEASILENKKSYLSKWASHNIQYHGKMLEAYSAMYADLVEDMERSDFIDIE